MKHGYLIILLPNLFRWNLVLGMGIDAFSCNLLEMPAISGIETFQLNKWAERVWQREMYLTREPSYILDLYWLYISSFHFLCFFLLHMVHAWVRNIKGPNMNCRNECYKILVIIAKSTAVTNKTNNDHGNEQPKINIRKLAYYKPVAMYSGAAYPWVPMTCVETWVLSPVGPAFANPKSESLALNSWIWTKQAVRFLTWFA